MVTSCAAYSKFRKMSTRPHMHVDDQRTTLGTRRNLNGRLKGLSTILDAAVRHDA